MAFQNIETIKRCCEEIRKDFTGFETITLERQEELDISLAKHIILLQNKNRGFINLRNILSEKLIVSGKSQLNLQNGDECAYFYIRVLDPELKLLKTYTENKEEFGNYCKLHFAAYDRYIIFLVNLEMYYQYHFIDLKNEEALENNQKRS